MYNPEESFEHPADKALQIQRLAQEIVQGAVDNLDGNKLLMGLEARAREAYVECATGNCKCGTQATPVSGECISYYAHTPENAPAAYAVEELDGLFIIVGYNGRALMGSNAMWLYQFSQSETGMRGKFDCRYSCLLTIKSRLGVRA